MSTKIRLARLGRRNLPFYHIVIADSRSPRDGKFIENIGYYDPIQSDDSNKRLVVKNDRAEYWLSVGAEPTERVAILLCNVGIEKAAKYKPKQLSKKLPRNKKK